MPLPLSLQGALMRPARPHVPVPWPTVLMPTGCRAAGVPAGGVPPAQALQRRGADGHLLRAAPGHDSRRGVRPAAPAGALHGVPRRLLRRAHLLAAGAAGHRGHVPRQAGEKCGRVGGSRKGQGQLLWQGGPHRAACGVICPVARGSASSRCRLTLPGLCPSIRLASSTGTRASSLMWRSMSTTSRWAGLGCGRGRRGGGG